MDVFARGGSILGGILGVGTVLKIGLIGRLILFGDIPLNIKLIALIMRSRD